MLQGEDDAPLFKEILVPNSAGPPLNLRCCMDCLFGATEDQCAICAQFLLNNTGVSIPKELFELDQVKPA